MRGEKRGIMAMDALCAGTLSLGAGLILLPAMGVAAKWLPLLAAVVLLLILCALWERRPWLPPAALAGAALLAYGIGAALIGAGAVNEAAAAYLRRAMEETAGGAPPFTVQLLCMLPVTVVFWALSRLGSRKKQLCLWITTLLAGGLIGYKAVFMPEGWLPPFLLLLGGMILYLPRAGMGRQGRLQARVLGAALCVPVLGLCLLIGPKEDGSWRCAALGYLIQDVQDLWEFRWGELPNLPLTSMRSMGLQPEGGGLGGDLQPSDWPVITGNSPALLRGRVYETYTGHGWESARTGNFRYESPFWHGRRREALGLDMPKPVSEPLMDDLLTETTVTLSTRRSFRTLFLPYRPESVELLRYDSDLYFDMQGEAYWSRTPKGVVEYRVKAEVWNYRDRDFDRNMLFLEQLLEQYEPDPGVARAAESCLQLPEDLPEQVKRLALELTGDCGSPYERAMALRDYLSGSCEYTLTPGPADPEKDFVAEFLTRGRGYCTYYASALTVLCRCAGVPARYVTGYGMRADNSRYIASEGTAHAWVEIYLGHIGWVPLDALGEDIFESETSTEGTAGGAAMGQPVTPSPTPGSGGGPLLADEPQKDGFDPMTLLWGVPVPAIMGWLLLTRLLRARRYRLKYVRAHYNKAAQGAEHVYRGMLRLLAMRKQKPQGGETLLGFWKRAALVLPEDVDWQEAGRIMDRLRFGGREPGWDEIEFLCGAYGRLAVHTRRALGIRGWFV